jgi:hypothetical protein
MNKKGFVYNLPMVSLKKCAKKIIGQSDGFSLSEEFGSPKYILVTSTPCLFDADLQIKNYRGHSTVDSLSHADQYKV